ncbi:FAD-binding oxidoreductase [uncultured Maritimibacter sp.]|uniref:NAD(P)/FAD-dependent oxidoreductase n=1 Tax=uncultured Maritimibacter sp. TaxID=991866 RepID=UPI0025919E8B|nr:FAD-binding oxidoreductase [uncultured Maritimibacter sp.]
MKIMPVHMEPTKSGWFAALGPRPPANTLSADIDCDHLVIGGGWMGLHCARRLGELDPEARVVLVDAGRIGDGAAGRCAGFAIDLAHNPRNKHFAEDKKGNEEEYHVNVEGIDYLRDAVERLGVDCDWDPSGKYHAAATPRGNDCLKEMSTALTQIGKPHTWLDHEEIQARTGSKHYFAAIHTPGTVLMQPAKYLVNMVAALPENVTVYEKTQVTDIDYRPQQHVCQTSGGEIRARKVFLCNAAYLTKSGFYDKTAIPVYTYASMTRQLTPAELAQVGASGPFGVIPAESFGTTMRLTNDNRLFLRNVYSYARGFRSGQSDVDYAKTHHEEAFRRRYPDLAPIGYENSWGGLLTMAENGGMVFGQLADRVYGAAFCNGTGVARGTGFGKALAELGLGHSSRSIDILNARTKPNRGYPAWLTEIGVRATTKWRFLRAGKET